MEDEEEDHTTVDSAMAIVADEGEAEGTNTLERSAQLRNDFAMILAPLRLTKVRSRQRTKQDNHGRNSCNTLARIVAKI